MLEAILISIGFFAMVGVTCFTVHLFGKIQEFRRSYNKFSEYQEEVVEYAKILRSKNKKYAHRAFDRFFTEIHDVNVFLDKLIKDRNFSQMIKNTEYLKEKIKWIEDNMNSDVPYFEEIINIRKCKEREKSIDEILNDNGDN